jgi:general secretion pathway protein G
VVLLKVENMRRKRSGGGFTLIEILLVVVIIGILAAIVVPRLTGTREDANIAKAKQEMATFRDALARFELDTGKYPTTEQGLISIVVIPSPEPKGWKGPYLVSRSIPKDPWGNDYIYRYPSQTDPKYFDLLTMGADGQEGTADDIDVLDLGGTGAEGDPNQGTGSPPR